MGGGLARLGRLDIDIGIKPTGFRFLPESQPDGKLATLFV